MLNTDEEQQGLRCSRGLWFCKGGRKTVAIIEKTCFDSP